jgi:site-specific recombinase XerD
MKNESMLIPTSREKSHKSKILPQAGVGSFTDYLKKQDMTNGSIESCETAVKLFLNWLEKQSIEPGQGSYADVLAYMKHCQKKGTTQRTVQNYLNMIKHFYGHLIEQGQIELNPVTGIKVQGVKRKSLYHTFNAQELHALYNQFNDPTLKGKRNKIMLGLLIYQGLKTEELGRLDVKDVKLKEGKVNIPGSRKGNARTLQLESHQVLEMYDYILQTRNEIMSKSGENSEKLFVSIKNGSDLHNYMTRLMVRLRKQNKLVLNAKQIRASVIMKWLKQYNLRQVQYLAGHRYISSTEGYQQNEMEGLTEEVNKFHPLG